MSGEASASRRASSGTQVPRHAPKALDPRAKLRYLRAVEACGSARDRALALLPLYAGTRIAEIRPLDVADVQLSARKGEIHIVGKGEKTRTVPAHPKLREALAAWLAERPAKPGADSAALFTSSRGTRMTTDAVAAAITAITTAAGMDDHVTSHVLRHLRHRVSRRRHRDRGRADGSRLTGDDAVVHASQHGGHAAGCRPADRRRVSRRGRGARRARGEGCAAGLRRRAVEELLHPRGHQLSLGQTRTRPDNKFAVRSTPVPL